MKRREFIAGLGGAAVAWPLTVRAQQQGGPVVGVLQQGRRWSPLSKAAFMQGLAEAGYVEGRNVVIEARFGLGDGDLREIAADFVRRRVAVIAAPGNTVAALAAKAATNAIPIIFSNGVDPVQAGLVRSLNQPGGNLTGYTEVNTEVWSKRLELLRTLAPTAARFGALDYPGNPVSEVVAKEARAATEAMGLPVEILSVSDDAGVEAVFSNLLQKRVDALLVSPGAFFYQRMDQIIRLAASHRVSAAYHVHDYPEAGGLMSYGSTIEEGFRQVGVYTGRILKGAKPADLPIVRTTKFELVINAKTAKALGLTIPPTLLALADEVIE
jgi:putative tryptophan/tyrosine transport system substrate-binding protein